MKFGDYVGLDRKSKSLSKWLRQGGTIAFGLLLFMSVGIAADWQAGKNNGVDGNRSGHVASLLYARAPNPQSDGIAELPLGGILRTVNERLGNQTFAKLKPDERYFWSLAASIFCLGIGWAIWPRVAVIGPLLILYGIAGFVGQFDLFSIFLMLR